MSKNRHPRGSVSIVEHLAIIRDLAAKKGSRPSMVQIAEAVGSTTGATYCIADKAPTPAFTDGRPKSEAHHAITSFAGVAGAVAILNTDIEPPVFELYLETPTGGVFLGTLPVPKDISIN
jgi:hypothetical protein